MSVGIDFPYKRCFPGLVVGPIVTINFKAILQDLSRDDKFNLLFT